MYLRSCCPILKAVLWEGVDASPLYPIKTSVPEKKYHHPADDITANYKSPTKTWQKLEAATNPQRKEGSHLIFAGGGRPLSHVAWVMRHPDLTLYIFFIDSFVLSKKPVKQTNMCRALEKCTKKMYMTGLRNKQWCKLKMRLTLLHQFLIL